MILFILGLLNKWLDREDKVILGFAFGLMFIYVIIRGVNIFLQ